MTRNRITTKANKLTKTFAAGLFGAALSATLALGPVQAAPAGAAQFGSVDISKVQTQSTKKAKYDTELRALADKLDTAFQKQTESIMLSKTEQTELGGLLTKPKPSETDTSRILALQTQANAAAQKLADLQQKKDPTPADTQQLAALTAQFQTGQKTLQDVGAGYQTQLKTLSDKDTTDFTQSVKDAISAVAQQKGLAMVFTSDVAVYTTNDITDEVVKRVNK